MMMMAPFRFQRLVISLDFRRLTKWRSGQGAWNWDGRRCGPGSKAPAAGFHPKTSGQEGAERRAGTEADFGLPAFFTTSPKVEEKK